MKKLLTLLLLVLFVSGISKANVADMLFSQSSGTYTEITGGTVVASGSFDNAIATNVPVGFTFNANGTNFTSMNVNSDGYVWFHPTSTSSLGYVPISSSTAATMSISPMARDMQNATGGEVRVETTGASPNRITIIQWKNVKRYGSSYPDEVLNFQVKLYETTNMVEFVYGPMTVTSTSTTANFQTGLRGSSNSDFNNRTTSTDWSATVAGTVNTAEMVLNSGVVPTNGLTYTFTVPAPQPALYSSPLNGITGVPIAASLNWAASSTGGAATGYRVYFGTDNPPTNIANGVDVGNALTYNPDPVLTYATQYFWQVVPYNGTGSATGNAIWSFTTSLGVGNLQGFVTNSFGIPMAGVTVTLANTQSSYSTVSGADGSYLIASALAADYTLTASIAGYNTTTLNVFVAPMTTTYQNIAMTHPSMAVTPNPYSVSLNPNEMVDGALNIANNGDGVLGWTATVNYTSPGPNTWLNLSQSTGSVAPYSNFSLPVAFDGSGLTSGTVKTAEITITSDPNVGTTVIPVTMTVSGTSLTAPTEFNAVLTNPVTGLVSLNWQFQTSSNFLYFTIRRDGVQVGTTTGNSYQNTLPGYGIYSYTVQAVFNEGNSSPAGPVEIEWSNPTLVIENTPLYNEQYPETSENVTFRISNTGEGTLAYSFPEYVTRQMLNSPEYNGNNTPRLQEVEVAKGESDPTAGMGTRNIRGAGGPDAFGYVWIDSDETGGAAYQWTDISTTGTAVTGFSDDNVISGIPIGFSFPFYENYYSDVNVSSNGYLIFGSTSSSISNQNLPNSSTPNNIIAWFWDDMNPTVSGTCHYQVVNGNFIIQFTNWNEYGSTGKITAQVVLYPNGHIRIYYNSINGLVINEATVGIENNTGTAGLGINYNSTYVHNGLAINIDFPIPTFITAVTPAQGQVAPGEFVDVVATFTSDNLNFPVGTYTTDLELNTNDLANEAVMIPATMVVYQPGMLSGTVTSAVDGSPIFGASVVAGSYSVLTDANGNYSITLDAGTYNVSFSKTGFTSETVTGVVVTATANTDVDAELEEVSYPATLVNAVVNEPDTQADVTWGVPNPDYEVLYDDGTAENFTAWALPGNMNAVKFTPAGYPATVYGGKIYVGDGSFPNNNTGFIGTTFGAMVMDDSGANGMPGTVLDSIEVTVNNYGWVEFSGLNAVVESGNFYLVMIQGGISPNVAGVGVDQQNPIAYRSYSRNVTAGQPWGVSPYQDLMIHALVSGPASDDNARSLTSNEMRRPLKQRGMISLLPATAQSGVEGNGQYLAIQNNQGSRDVTGYKVWRIAVTNPDQGPDGTLTILNNNVTSTNYTDASFGPLPEGWYAYAVAANYTNGGESVKAYSNIVGHKKLADVTVNVSLTTGGSPAGAVVSLTGSDYPHSVLTQTVPEDGTVVFADVWKGNYTLSASKVGFDDYTITPNIQSNRTFDIVLAERKYKPRNLYVDDLSLVATWDEPLAIAVIEDFEGATFPPAGWQALTQNTTGWYATTNGSSANFVIPSHTKYAVTNDDAENGDGCCDYLITPVMDWTNLPSYRINFASYFDGSYSQSAYVEISTDGGSSWTVINTLAPAAGAWQDIEIDLAQYSGATGLNNVMLSFHADDNGEWSSGWAIDDVQIASGGVPLQGYGVFLDGTLIGNTMDLTYTYTNLNFGQEYLAGVAALFSSGYSELDTYRFTSKYLIPPDNLAGENPTGTSYVHLTWTAPVVPTAAPSTDNLPVIQAQPAADVAINVNTTPFPQRSVPMSSSRNVLFDNGTIINSPGTGSGGADESILQGDLGMTTYGSGMQQSAGNSIAEDFEVTANWNLETIEFFGYQTGSTTTSTFTGVFYRIYDGDPTAGGTVIYGDLTTNKLVSTQWANIYRNDNGPGGSTDRPVMQIVADASDLTLSPGTYWIEWTTAGSGSSGPWCPAVTIEGQTTTGNALQNQAGTWVPLVDVGPQGMPFIINGSGGGSGGSVANLLGYNIYRDDAMVAFVPKPNLEYFDLNLAPATYKYHITGVYDLSMYGFPGQTAESMIEGPINVDVVYGYELPFTETFTTGVFETNQWTVNGNNWHIAGQTGNPAPAAEFSYAPVATNYEQSIESFYLIGSGMIDGSIKLDFDLKHTLINPSETEKLAIEVNNGSGWVQVAQFTNAESIDWTAQSIDITGRAKGHVFRVRFVAKGENTTNINNWLIDNVHIYRICEAPINLVAEINEPNNDQVLLTWEAPNAPGPGVSGWLAWDDGTNVDAIGLTGGGTFLTGVRFTPDQLTQYAGTSLTKVRMFPYGPNGSIVLKVWTGANASQLLLSQPIASYTAGQWNEFALTTPVPVTGTTELWIGYEVTHNGTDYVGGIDAGPAVAGYGDMISMDGSVWESMSQAYGLDGNWNTEGFVETLDGTVTPLQPIINNTVYNNTSAQLVRGNYPTLPGASINSSSRELTGYNVYRDGAVIATTSETSYVDADETLTVGQTYCYKVTAVYEDCESDFSNEECILITSTNDLELSSVNVYPNPSNNVVNIELSGNVSQFAVFNYTGQIVFQQTITKAQTVQLDVHNFDAGAYLIKFTTRSGESFTKKIAVTK